MMNTHLQRLDTLIRPDRTEQLAKDHGWRKRKGKISGFQFLHSALGQASAVDLTLRAQAGTFPEPVTRQAVDQRYNPAAVAFLKAAFQDSLATTLAWKTDSAMTQLLRQSFQAVRLFDSTHFPCSDALAELFPGGGGGGGTAGIKVLLGYDYATGQLHPLALLPAKRSDQGLADQVAEQIGQDELGLFDKGFYKAQSLRTIAARGGYFLVPWHHNVSVWPNVDPQDASAQPPRPIDIAAQLKVSTQTQVEWTAVQLGQTEESRLGPLRLIAYRLPEERANRRRAQLREKCHTHGRQPTLSALELAGWVNSAHQRFRRPAAHPGGGFPLPRALAGGIDLQTMEKCPATGCPAQPKPLPRSV